MKIAASQNENSRHCVNMGTDVGEPDLRLSARVGGVYYMFYLELKRKKGKISASQTSWRDDFKEYFECNNARWEIAYGLPDAREKIIAWLDYISEPK